MAVKIGRAELRFLALRQLRQHGHWSGAYYVDPLTGGMVRQIRRSPVVMESLLLGYPVGGEGEGC